MSASPGWAEGGERWKRAPSFQQSGFAEESAGADKQHERHDDEHHDLGQLRREEGGEAHHLADDDAGHDRAEQASHAADHHDHEGLDHHRDAHLGVDGPHRAGQDTGQTGQPGPDAEDEQPDASQVEAEGPHHERIARAGADDEPDVGALEEEPEADEHEHGNRDDEEAIEREGHEAEVESAAERAGRVDGQPDLAPDDADGLHDDQRETEREQERIVDRAPVERAHEHPLDYQPQDEDHEWRRHQRDPEVLREPEQEDPEVRSQHVERAVGEIHHRHQPKDQAEADGEQDEDPPEHEAGENLGGQRRRRDVEHYSSPRFVQNTEVGRT